MFNIKLWLRWIGLACLFTALPTPLIVTPALWYPFVTGKAFWFRACVSLATACVLASASLDGSRLRLTRLETAFAVLLLALVLADSQAIDVRSAFLGSYERMGGWMEMAYYAAYVFAAGRLLRQRNITPHLATALAVSLIVAFFAVYELAITGASRTFAAFGNASYLSDYAMLTIFLALYLYASRAGWTRWLCAAAIAACGLSLYCGGSRAAMVGLFLGCALAARLGRGNRSWRRWCIASALSPILGIPIGLARNGTLEANSMFQRFVSLSSSGENGNIRFYFWRDILPSLWHKPWLGYGQESVRWLYFKYASPEVRAMSHSIPFDRAHNLILDWLASGGIVALAAWIGVLYAAAWTIRWSGLSATKKAALYGLGAAYLFNGMFIFDTSATLMPVALALAIAASVRRDVVDGAAHILNHQASRGVRQSTGRIGGRANYPAS